jgi:Ca-activated chloride channel family protein
MTTTRARHGLIVGLSLLLRAVASGANQDAMPGGELRILAPGGEQMGACPLQHTDVDADIAGFVGRVHVRQTFHNPLSTKIEAVYVFPLPHDAAVDDMVLMVGDRKIVAEVKPRDQARAVYDAARARGHVASLLDQERPNIFTQSVANIERGAQVLIDISYVETLAYEDGEFAFVFPMVVGPRYVPGTPAGKQGTGWAPDTTVVPDASRITPPVALPGTRAGHDISLTVHVDAGTELLDLKSELHDVHVENTGAGRATVTLKNVAEIPNRDFILRYRTAGERIEDAFLVHTDERGGFFTLILQPPRRVMPTQAMPKEMIFVIDRSGSMIGFPIEKAKETMRRAIQNMNPDDTFNLLSFSGGTGRCFDKPVPNTAPNRALALRYLDDLFGSGGTEMLPAIYAALGGPADPHRLRIVCFMTDGYVGDDVEIIDAVKRNAGTARVFAFGIGHAVNRFLLAGMAQAGRGDVELVTRATEADEAAERFRQRIASPVLADIEIDWGTLAVSEVYPNHYPDLFSVKPLMIHGRLNGPAEGTITLRGRTGSGPFERRIRVATANGTHPALASLWARAKVGDLTMADYTDWVQGNLPAAVRDQIVALAVQFRLLTPYTSFVAVEEMRVTVGGEPTTIAVPVEMPDSVSYEGVFGEARAAAAVGGAFNQAVQRPASRADEPSLALSMRGLSAAPAAGAVGQDAKLMHEAVAIGAVHTSAANKLANDLRGLAARVAKEGTDGTLTLGKLRVIHYQVDVMIYLNDASPDTIAALQKLGFVQKAESQAVRLVIGSVDVRQLEELAKLAAVATITAAVG